MRGVAAEGGWSVSSRSAQKGNLAFGHLAIREAPSKMPVRGAHALSVVMRIGGMTT
jgi:hypothetical protein